MTTILRNKLLMATEQKIESSLLEDTRAAYDKIIVAGMKVGLADGREGILAGLVKSKDPLKDSARGAINIVLLLRKQSRDTMPAKAIPPAAMTLMLQALDFADRAGIVKIGPKQLTQATRHFTNYIFECFKITLPMLQKMGVRTNQLMNDPTSMEKIGRRAGLVKVPEASTPSGIINAPPRVGER